MKINIGVLAIVIIVLFLIGITIFLFTNETERVDYNLELCESKGYEGAISYRYPPMCYKYNENDIKIKEEIRGLKWMKR